jgi:cytochrome c biogenesis protein CcmG/thiol:disulfide interchange protein DsbE
MNRYVLFGLLGAGLVGMPPVRAEFPRGKPAPSFKLRRLDGPPLSLSDLRGKVVFLDFWGPS